MEVSVVFNQTENRNVHHACHFYCLGNNHGNKLLRRGYDDNAVNRQGLEDGQRYVTGSRRHINKHKVYICPDGIAPKLLYHAGEQRPAPNNRVRIILQKHIGRKHLQTAGSSQRQNTDFVGFGLAVYAKVMSHGRTGDISIQNSTALTAALHTAC